MAQTVTDANRTILEDEIECLKASFSPNEMEIIKQGSDTAVIKFEVGLSSRHDNLVIAMTFTIPSTYPSKYPRVSLRSACLQRHQREEAEKAVQEYAATMLGYPMIMELVAWTKNYVEELMSALKTASPLAQAVQESYVLVASIDHMRSESKYIKNLKCWSHDLNIKGGLLLFGRMILLILQGTRSCVKEFIVRLRTSCVDVTSAGKACKEKMSKILHEGNSTANFQEFAVNKFSRFAEVEHYLSSAGLEDVYINFISYK